MKTGIVMLGGLALLAVVETSEAASSTRSYQPPPPPPPRPAPSTPYRAPSSSPSTPYRAPSSSSSASIPKSQSSTATTSSPKSQTVKPSAPLASTKSGSPSGAKPTDYSKLSSTELQKTIGAHNQQIANYRTKVSNPRASYPNWDSLSKQQQGALLRQWNTEIQRNETGRANAQRMLSQKSR